MIGSDVVEVLNASFDSGLLPSSQREALISLIFKKGDRLEHKNWRPISLLNVDYKLFARVLAGRLLKVIHAVVAPDQTCGVGCLVVSSARMLLYFVMLPIMPLSPTSLLLSCLWIKRKPLIVKIGTFFWLSYVAWVLAPHLSAG